MKVYAFDLNPNIINYNSSIRNKVNIIKILIEIARFLNRTEPQLMENIPANIEDKKIRLVIHIEKMSRILIVEKEKIHSFNFPFVLKIENNKYVLSLKNSLITSATCSVLGATFNGICDFEPVEKILEQYWDVALDLSVPSEENEFYTRLITHLLCFEAGYLRFDYDKVTHDEKIHPNNHIDINYSAGATYKIGLKKQIDVMELIDIINIKTPCAFIANTER